LQRFIQQKIKGKKPSAKGATPPPYTKMQDLMTTLKRSLEQEKGKSKRYESRKVPQKETA
jgi:non-homologous end joining protein Ku